MNIIDLRKKQLLELLESLVVDYSYLLTEDDFNLIDCINESGLGDFQFRQDLEEIVERVWKYELESNQYKVISWNKGTCHPNRDVITFATISLKDSKKE